MDVERRKYSLESGEYARPGLLSRGFKRLRGLAKQSLERKHHERIASQYDLNGYKRVYQVHIRKTGGTSLNKMFMGLTGHEPEDVYYQLLRSSDTTIVNEGLIFTGWRLKRLMQGRYFYGFSHEPYPNLSLPSDTFTVTVFRDPAKRVISLYNMLMSYRVNNINHPCMAVQGKWLGDHFRDFMNTIPREHFHRQIYMFSLSFDLEEAAENINSLSHYFFLESFDEGVTQLNSLLNLNLKSLHNRKSDYKAEISEDDLAELREKLAEEYRLMEMIGYPKIRKTPALT